MVSRRPPPQDAANPSPWLAVLLGSVVVWNPVGYLSYQPAKALIAWIVILGVCAWSALRRTTIHLALVPMVALATLATAILVSYVWNDTSWVGFQGWMPRALGLTQWALLSAFFIAGLASGGAWRRVMPCIDWFAILAGVIGLAQWAGIQPVQGGTATARVGTVFGSATSAGAFAALLLPLLVDNLDRSARRPALVRRSIAIGLTVAVLIAAGNRTAAVAAGAGLLVVAACRRRARSSVTADARSTRRLVALAATAVVVLFGVVNFDRLRSLGDADSTASGRVVLWQASLDAAVEHPLLGTGPESTRSVLPRFLPEDFEARFGDTVIEDRAHNAVLDILLAHGIFGVLAFLGLALVVGVGAFRNRLAPAGAGVAGLLLAYAVHLTTNFVATEPDLFAWFFCGVAAQTTALSLRRRAPRDLRVGPAVFALVAVLALVATVHSSRQVVADALLRRGVDLEATGPDQAIIELRTAATWGAEQPYLWEMLARAQWKAGHVDDAAASVARSIAAAGGSDLSLLELAADIDLERALSTGGGDTPSIAAVESQYARLAEMAEFNGSIRSGLGAAMAAQGRLDEALVQLRLATTLSPSNVTAWIRRAVVEDALGRCDDARTSMEAARALPDFVAPTGRPSCIQ